MSTNIYQAIFDELLLRINTARTNGRRLEKHQIAQVRIGDVLEANSPISSTRIVIRDININGNMAFSNLQDEDKLSFVIECQVNSVHGINTLYDADRSTGPLLLYSDLIDTIERTIEDRVDVNFSGLIQGRFSHDGIFDTGLGDVYKVIIPVTMQTKKFAVASRTT